MQNPDHFIGRYKSRNRPRNLYEKLNYLIDDIFTNQEQNRPIPPQNIFEIHEILTKTTKCVDHWHHHKIKLWQMKVKKTQAK